MLKLTSSPQACFASNSRTLRRVSSERQAEPEDQSGHALHPQSASSWLSRSGKSVRFGLHSVLSVFTFLACFALASTTQAATPFEFSRDVAELNFASERLARELRSSPGYGSLRAAAERLSDDAEQLQESVDRGRSHAYIRLQISDMRRRYQHLQVAVAKTRGEGASELITEHMANITALYEGLNAEHFYSHPDTGVAALYSPFQYTAPVIIFPNEEGEVDLSNPYLPAEMQRWIDAGNAVRPQTGAEARSAQRVITEQTTIEQGFDHRSNVLDRETVRRWQTPTSD